jgi:predicted O-methyltransferase YrrM
VRAIDAVRERLRWHRFRIGTHRQSIREYGGFWKDPLWSTRFVLFDREVWNYTYDIDNAPELGAVLDEALGVRRGTALEYISELERDDELRRHLDSRFRTRRDRNPRAHYGRRAGWYALARIHRPTVVLETGTHDGLGTAVLLRALWRNAAQGTPGRLISLDVRDDVGWLIRDSQFAAGLELLVGDAHVLLPQLLTDVRLDMFVHDSDHSYDHQRFEFETVYPHCTPGALLISDDAHGSSAFADFCRERGLRWWIARERPRHHPYPGAAIGLAVLDATKTETGGRAHV